MKKILLIEENEDFKRKLEGEILAENNLALSCVSNLSAAREKINAEAEKFDLFVLDSESSEESSLKNNFCSDFGKNSEYKSSILILDKRENLLELDQMVKSGAADFLLKPFSIAEFVEKIEVLLDLQNDPERKVNEIKAKIENEVGKESIEELTPKENAILNFFIRHPNEIIPRDKIFEYIWPFNTKSGSNVIDVHIKNLRKKIWPDKSKSLIETVWGGGYRFSII